MTVILTILKRGLEQAGAEIEFGNLEVASERSSDVAIATLDIPSIHGSDYRAINSLVPFQIEIQRGVACLSRTIDDHRGSRGGDIIDRDQVMP